MSEHKAMRFGVYAELEGTSHAPGEARNLISDALGEDHPQADEARLAVSELVTNAITHSVSGQPGGTVIISVEAATPTADVSIQVRDAGGLEAPLPHAVDIDSEHGRGLSLISAIAAEWGSEPSGTGRATWCRLARTPSATVSPGVPEREAG